MDFEKFCKENCVERRGTGTLKAVERIITNIKERQ